MTTLRNRIGHWMRKYAERIDPAPSKGETLAELYTKLVPASVAYTDAGIFESGGQTRQMGPRPSVSTGSGSGTDWRPDTASVWIVSGGGGGGGHYSPPDDGPAPALVLR